jgi:hypothetical protein
MLSESKPLPFIPLITDSRKVTIISKSRLVISDTLSHGRGCSSFARSRKPNGEGDGPLVFREIEDFKHPR